MYTASIENSNGEVLTLTNNESNYQVISIKGLNPPSAQINTTNIAGLDGAKFNSAKLNTRNIVIMLKINGDVEENRQLLYQFFRTKENCVFYFSNNNRNVSIAGYVETVECDLFKNGETMQISIVCPYPYFKNISDIVVDMSNETALFTFPFSINLGDPIAFSIYNATKITNVVNGSESTTGIIINIDILSAINEIQIKNVDSDETLTLNYAFQENDEVIINTNKGQKSISLIRNGVKTNIFSALQKNSVFFQLQVGSNRFGYIVDGGETDADVFITFTYTTLYRGV